MTLSAEHAVFSPDGKAVLTTSGDRTARLWDLSGRETAVLRGHEDTVRHGVFSPAGDSIMTVSGDGTVRLWDRNGKERAVIRGGSTHPILAAPLFSPDGTRAIWPRKGGPVAVTDLAGREIALFQGHRQDVTALAGAADGSLVLTGSEDGTAKIWSTEGK
ncbi:MAG: hypothetical protein L6Q95_17755, partial [Planctomycetes bacterium]|nr:hypothetical protein [Planctomycetota bacterium]